MKKRILVLLGMVLLATGCSLEAYYGSDYMITETRNVTGFNKIQIEGLFEVNIDYGTVQSVEVIANDNIIDRIRTQVENNELKVYFKNGNYRNIDATLNITIPELSAVEYGGSGIIEISNFQQLEVLKLSNTGSGDFILDGGTAELLKWINEGSGHLEASSFDIKNIIIESRGSGNATVRCSETLDTFIEGSGIVYYYGNPTLSTEIIGSGKVIKKD